MEPLATLSNGQPESSLQYPSACLKGASDQELCTLQAGHSPLAVIPTQPPASCVTVVGKAVAEWRWGSGLCSIPPAFQNGLWNSRLSPLSHSLEAWLYHGK